MGRLHSNWSRVAGMYLSLSCARAIADVAALARDRPSMLRASPIQAPGFRGAALRVRGRQLRNALIFSFLLKRSL